MLCQKEEFQVGDLMYKALEDGNGVAVAKYVDENVTEVIIPEEIVYGHYIYEVSQDAPGRLGIWLGWRIVESYMEHNESISLQELMSEPDAQKILESSFYKQTRQNRTK